ncbi:MAG: CapA family protein [Bacillaceae bacterium]|nr:CapA family protein [Bacillaceae bacterium]
MKRLLLYLVVFLGFLFSAVLFVYFVQGEPKLQVVEEESDDTINLEESDLEPIEELEVEVEEVKKEITSATIAGVGDILIHESLNTDAYKDGTFDFRPMLELVKPYLQNADLAFANQETMLGGVELGLTGYPRFNSPVEVGDALLDAGIDIVSIANNHTIDIGEKAIINAINHYNQIGMLYTGSYLSEEDKKEIRLIEKNGIVFSFLAYSYGTNGIHVPEGKEYLINLIDIGAINEEIIRAKAISDVVVLSLHFGNEYEPLPNETQKLMAEEFAKTGADIIFGHHPHVLQPFDWIDQEDGRRTFVAYSLGNFFIGAKRIRKRNWRNCAS